MDIESISTERLPNQQQNFADSNIIPKPSNQQRFPCYGESQIETDMVLKSGCVFYLTLYNINLIYIYH